MDKEVKYLGQVSIKTSQAHTHVQKTINKVPMDIGRCRKMCGGIVPKNDPVINKSDYAHNNLWINPVVAKDPTGWSSKSCTKPDTTAAIITTPTSVKEVLLSLTQLHLPIQKRSKVRYIQTE